MRKNTKALTAAQQYYALKNSSYFVGQGILGRNRFTWNYEAQPTPVSRKYTIKLTFQQECSPKIIVNNPNLAELANGRILPHVYEQNPARLCLYLPRVGEWRPDLLIEKTVVPWSFLWLFHYEIWLATDKWEGGGVHPKIKHD